MVGQGSPSTGRRFALRVGWPVGRFFRPALAALLALTAQVLAAAEPTMQLRVSWGGGAERQWHGSISIDKGTLALVRPLAIVADSPGSIWAASDTEIDIREKSIRDYDGADVEITAPSDARITVSLAADAEPRAVSDEILISDLTAKLHRHKLDEHDNQLLVRRGSSDMLRVATDHDPLIFTPGEIWKLDVKPRLLPVAAGTTVYLKCRLLACRAATEIWSEEHTIKTTSTDANPSVVPLEVKLPETEGVYDLVIEASERGPLLRWPKPIVERRVQVIVLGDRPVNVANDSTTWTQLLEIDPANPHWYDRFKSLRLSTLITAPLGKDTGPTWQGPIGSGNSQIVQNPLGRIVQLAAASKEGDASWEAYPLAIAKPGAPHILEVDYPSDVEQTLGISIIEPNAAGAVAPIELDSGFYASPSAVGGQPSWLKHRLLFWPRSSSPVVLLTNRRDGARAVYGKLRLLSGPQHLKPAFPGDDRGERLLAGYLDRPLFAANFSASESLDAFTGHSLSDWQTFYEGGARLAEYLNSTAQNGVMMAVLSGGSAIYPSKLLEPTPRFDTGTFFDLGQDPMRKDVLELLLRLFDREQLKFIPMLQFSTPLPELEAAIRDGGPNSVGLEWVGRDGAAWTDVNESRHSLAPYYNVLDPRVQDAMLHVIHELVARYGGHPSLSGLAIELSADGFAQLPGEAWGLDDRTIARFEQEAHVSVPGQGRERFAERESYVTGAGRRAWLLWRSEVLADFYRRVQRELAAVRPDARLYLAPTNMLNSRELERDLRPGLPSHGRIDEALLAVGIRPESYRNEKGIVLLRQQRISPPGSLATQAIDIETNRSSDWDAAIHVQRSSGSLFYHEPQRLRLASFDAKSPFGKDKTYTLLVSQLSPSQDDNRRRFVHSLAALDSDAMFDGGWLLPLGQEPALKDLIAAYRRLPAERFETVADSIEPITVRSLHSGGRTYAYVVNDSPWPVRVTVQVEGPPGTRPEELGGQHSSQLKGSTWTIDLAPYDLEAVLFGTEEVKLSSPQVIFSDEAKATLAGNIRELHNRRAILESPPPLPLLSNPGFELPALGNQIPGWSWTAGPGEQVSLDSANPHAGKQSLHFQSRGGVVSLRSEPFATPQTGRLAVSIWLKVADPADQPQLRLVLGGIAGSRPFHRIAPLGQGQGVKPIPSQWKQYILPIDDLQPDAP
ncbi:MAG TPA: family 10 glycosylhydrolase, partial [Pirellulales bacterium]|nr:family 10 glycosylhydrolase [Pirellulales bacterium]